MRFRVKVAGDSTYHWVASSLDEPHCNAEGASRELALDALRNEIRYRMEYCACLGSADDYVQLEIVE